jgi:Na+/H+-dicarboxylate symporter
MFSVKPLVELTDGLQRLVRNRLWARILLGMGLGLGIGMLLSPEGGALVSPETSGVLSGWFALPGQIFLALIQMVVLPLVVASIVLGVASSGNLAELKTIGGRIGAFFVATTAFATTLGIVLALWIQPGDYLDRRIVQDTLGPADFGAAEPAGAGIDLASLPDRIVALIPSDPVRAALDRSMLHLVAFARLMGVARISIPTTRAQPLLDLSGSLQEVSLKVVGWAMLLAPYAVFGLLAQISIRIGPGAIVGLSVYVGTVLAGLLGLAALFLALAWLARVPPWRFIRATREVLLLAFSTSSSAAVMPLSMKTVQEKLGVSPSIAQFVIPVGATVNMAGTALYQVVAAVFLTQVFDVSVSLGDLVLLSVTTIGASIGSPSSPGAGIVILATILQGMGIPPGGVALIMGVDRILDMSRTAINVTGDLVGCVVLERWIELRG